MPSEKAADILRIDMRHTDDLVHRKDSMHPTQIFQDVRSPVARQGMLLSNQDNSQMLKKIQKIAKTQEQSKHMDQVAAQ